MRIATGFLAIIPALKVKSGRFYILTTRRPQTSVRARARVCVWTSGRDASSRLAGPQWAFVLRIII